MIWVMCSKAKECPGLAEKRQAGTWDSLLQRCTACTWTNLSSSDKIPRNYKILKKCMHAHLGQIMQKNAKDRKSQLLLLKSWEQKQGVGSKKQVIMHGLCIQHHLRGGQTSYATLPSPWTHYYSHPI